MAWPGDTHPHARPALVTIRSHTEIVGLFAQTQTWQRLKNFSDLGGGEHTIQIKVLGTRTKGSKGTWVVVDGFSGPIMVE